MEIGFVCFPYSLSDILEVAQEADRAERPVLFGIADSPRLFAESYVAQQHVLAGTRNLLVGPFATNPVTRHWSIHAAAHRSLEELFPGRLFFGLAAGDSAVHAFGLPPASPARLLEHAQKVKEFGPPGLRVILAAGGPKSTAKAVLATDEVVIGQGVDAGATRALVSAAVAARRDAALDEELKPWLYVLADVWDSDDGARDDAARSAFRSVIMAYSRQAMSGSFEGKNVPAELQPRLNELYSSFSFEDYVGSSHNSRLLDRFAPEEEFVTRRFALSGPPESIAAELEEVAETTGVARIWIGLLTKDAAPMMRLLVERALPLLQGGRKVAT